MNLRRVAEVAFGTAVGVLGGGLLILAFWHLSEPVPSMLASVPASTATASSATISVHHPADRRIAESTHAVPVKVRTPRRATPGGPRPRTPRRIARRPLPRAIPPSKAPVVAVRPTDVGSAAAVAVRQAPPLRSNLPMRPLPQPASHEPIVRRSSLAKPPAKLVATAPRKADRVPEPPIGYDEHPPMLRVAEPDDLPSASPAP